MASEARVGLTYLNWPLGSTAYDSLDKWIIEEENTKSETVLFVFN